MNFKNEGRQMRYLKIFSITVLSVLFLQACNDDDDDEMIVEEVMPNTIVDVAVSNGSFTTLVAALQATGLDATLSDTGSKFTVFAPTDDAFALIGDETINTLLANTDVLSSILLQHVVSGAAVDSVTAY